MSKRTVARLFSLLAVTVLLAAGCPPPDGNGGNGGNVSQAVLDMELDAFQQVNAERTSRFLAALTMREDLRSVARAHSEDMLARDFFSHVNPDFEDPFDRMAAAGITFRTAGENIAWNSGFGDPVGTAVDGWMNSEGHRENILREAFTHTGMGVADDGNGGYHFTQLFSGFSKDVPEGYIYVYYDIPIAQSID